MSGHPEMSAKESGSGRPKKRAHSRPGHGSECHLKLVFKNPPQGEDVAPGPASKEAGVPRVGLGPLQLGDVHAVQHVGGPVGADVDDDLHNGPHAQSWAFWVFIKIFSIVKNDFFAFFIKLIIYKVNFL